MKTTQHEIEVILTRQLASYLSTPIFLVDVEGTLLFYNEPAEAILGHRFEETGEMPADEWSTVFTPTDDDGAVIPPEGLPLLIALRNHGPAHRTFWIRALDGVSRHIEVTALPLIGQSKRIIGAVAIFWEKD
jgi:PAS domain-containing protein